MGYETGFNFLQMAFFFVVPVLLFLILFLIYQNFYLKDQKKPKLIVLYSKTMIWVLSFFIIIVLAKVGDDFLDTKQSLQYEKINLEQVFYVDLYGCNQKHGNYDYQGGSSNLTEEEIEACRVEQRELQQKYTEINQKGIMYKSIYRVGVIAILLIIHIILYYSVRNRKEQ
ncbi:MAG: hypothetical protein M0P94_00835 [Candidatus Absconditabacterales bacterium]|nr:hypothetical protein [Candidatus Absconditabacterales bacterium]